MSNDPNRMFTVKDIPIQRAGQDEILREYTFAGPDTGRDTRLIFERKTIEHLMDVSRASQTGRVVCMGAGFRLRVRRDARGRMYETLHVVCAHPMTESIAPTMKMGANETAKELRLNQYSKGDVRLKDYEK
tara:strand:+ start:1127 stop:1519 length:393 start_codon:yes stop_codon:yes gene_type:complete